MFSYFGIIFLFTYFPTNRSPFRFFDLGNIVFGFILPLEDSKVDPSIKLHSYKCKEQTADAGAFGPSEDGLQWSGNLTPEEETCLSV